MVRERSYDSREVARNTASWAQSTGARVPHYQSMTKSTQPRPVGEGIGGKERHGVHQTVTRRRGIPRLAAPR
jgi:hypothetical protein